jgi:surface protein
MHSQIKTIKATSEKHLRVLIDKEITQYGPTCSLNHIDVSNIRDMARLFQYSEFNGDLSQWDTSNVTNMGWMFKNSIFNGDISQWNTSKVETIGWMLVDADFNGDLRPWRLTEKQMEEVFKETLPNYLAIRQNIEDAEKLHATFAGTSRRAKKAL